MRRIPVTVSVAFLLLATPARAADRSSAPDVDEADPQDRRADADARGELDQPFVLDAPLWLSVGAGAEIGPAVRGLTGMVALTASLEALAAPRLLRRAASSGAEDDAAEVEQEKAPPPRPALTGRLARACVRAALAAARSGARLGDLDDLETRARVSGLAPELRLRLAHQLDEDQALAPTEYDPERVTAAGGTSLWLEARATFRLDRLVFADEEVAIERLRMERERADRALSEEVTRVLAAWQRADARSRDEALEAAPRFEAELEAAAAEARLDVLTDGWFSTHRPAPATGDVR